MRRTGPNGAPFVDSQFYSTVSVVRTMESLLGLPPMNNNDAFCSQIASLFTGPGDQAPYTADYSNRDNGLIYTANKKNAVGARASMKMDFSHADRAPVEKLNVILWKDAMGDAPVPADAESVTPRKRVKTAMTIEGAREVPIGVDSRTMFRERFCLAVESRLGANSWIISTTFSAKPDHRHFIFFVQYRKRTEIFLASTRRSP